MRACTRLPGARLSRVALRCRNLLALADATSASRTMGLLSGSAAAHSTHAATRSSGPLRRRAMAPAATAEHVWAAQEGSGGVTRADVAKSFTAARVLPRTFARQKRSTMASYHHLFHARLALAGRKLSVASASAAEMPASPALWPASAMTRSCASGHARCRSQAERIGHTTS